MVPAKGNHMSAVRKEVLRYLADSGPITVGSGESARKIVVDAVLPLLQERYGTGTPGSISVAISHMITGRTLEAGGRSGSREYRSRHRLALTEAGRNELRLYLENDPAEADEFERLFGHTVIRNEPEPTEAVGMVDPDSTPVGAAPGPIDYKQLAQAVLAELGSASTAPDEQRAHDQLVIATRDIGEAHSQIDDLRRELATRKEALTAQSQQLLETRRELVDASRTHSQLNETIANLNSELHRLRSTIVRNSQNYGFRIEEVVGEDEVRRLREIAREMESNRGVQLQ